MAIRSTLRLLSLASIVLASSAAHAQSSDESLTGQAADQRVTEYLSSRGLDQILAAHHRAKLTEGTPDERKEAAEALGVLYSRQLAATNDPTERKNVEERCRELLKLIPDAETFELRINLAKTTYLKAEEIAERDRLRLASPAERDEAMRILESIAPVFKEIAGKVGKKSDALERSMEQAREDKIEQTRLQVAEMRRLRSLARYYAGWSELYKATLTSSPEAALSALVEFGYLLNATEGKPPNYDRLPRSLMKYEHIARATMGCALALSIRNDGPEATRWLSLVETTEGVSQPVLDQLLVRWITVSGSMGNWSQIEARLLKLPGSEDPSKAIHPAIARLIVVGSMEYLLKETSSSTNDPRVESARRCATLGMGALVGKGELAQVVDLVKRYGDSTLGVTGFVPEYVRAMQSYERARDSHKKEIGSDPALAALAEEPPKDSQTRDLYRAVAGQFAKAAAGSDAARFPQARVRAQMIGGLALFYAGEYERAALEFSGVSTPDAPDDLKRDSMWYAVLSLDRAIENGKTLEAPVLKKLSDQRDRVSMLYVAAFPRSDRAAQLLMRRAGTGLLSDEKAAEILLGVDPVSPIYPAARRQAAKLLYQAYRKARGKERDFAALRFAGIAEQVLASEAERSIGDVTSQSAKDAAATAILYARQIADAMLSIASPDVARAETALGNLDKVALVHSLDLASVEGEITFRRLQIALAKGDEAAAAKLVEKLGGGDAEYPRAAARLMYRRALDAWHATARATDAIQTVNHGQRLIAQLERSGTKLPDPILAGIYDSVAAAASALASADPAMRETALRLDRALIAANIKTQTGLKRLGVGAEAAGDLSAALAAWKELVSAIPTDNPAWYEARYESIRILAKTDLSAAAIALAQHKALYPSMGPEPWGSKLKALEAQIGPPPPESTSPKPPSAGGNSEGDK
ncbi:MAG: hypothetical protein AABZ53_02225 [Planctomycetota bacterium]